MSKREGGLRTQGFYKAGTVDKPLVSIVTVVYNIIENGRERHFREMMNSVQKQDYGRDHIEHIIIDGDSTDSTLDLIEEFVAGGFVDYWRSEKDTGVYQAMNRGIECSRGELVSFMNSDDYFTPAAVRLSVEGILKSGADYSYATAEIIDHKGNRIATRDPHFIEFVYFVIPFCHQTMFLKKEWFEKIGPFDESLRISGDWDLVLRLHLAGGRPVCIDEVLVCFRDQGISDGILDNPEYHDERRRIQKKNYLDKLELDERELIYLETFIRNPLIGRVDKTQLLSACEKLNTSREVAYDFYLLLVRVLLINKIDEPGFEIPFNRYFKPIAGLDNHQTSRKWSRWLKRKLMG